MTLLPSVKVKYKKSNNNLLNLKTNTINQQQEDNQKSPVYFIDVKNNTNTASGNINSINNSNNYCNSVSTTKINNYENSNNYIYIDNTNTNNLNDLNSITLLDIGSNSGVNKLNNQKVNTAALNKAINLASKAATASSIS